MLLNTRSPRLIHPQALRQSIGWLGLLLPAALIVGNYGMQHCTQVQSSISHYYYTVTGPWLVGVLFAAAMFLFSYKGYNRMDSVVTSIAGFAALVVALFPTNQVLHVPAQMVSDPCILFSLNEANWRNAIHYAGAAVFFLALACNALFLFTKSTGPKTPQKKMRNRLFRTCGGIMIIALALIALYGLFDEKVPGLKKYHPVFWLEWLALAAFGISWLVKGQLILSDEKGKAR